MGRRKVEQPKEPKSWSKRYADLLALYNANEGDEATQDVIMATIEALDLTGIFTELLRYDTHSNDELFDWLDSNFKVDYQLQDQRNQYILKTLAVLRNRCKDK